MCIDGDGRESTSSQVMSSRLHSPEFRSLIRNRAVEDNIIPAGD